MSKMPTSFSSKISKAKEYAGGKGNILLHILSSDISNAPSIMGLSQVPKDYEILVSDYNWKVLEVRDQRINGDGYYHITFAIDEKEVEQ